MLELLKKLGIPAALAAIIVALGTLVPVLFKLDERYAKEQELTQEVVRLEGQINDLSTEVGKLAGSTQVLVDVISAKGAAPAPAPQVVYIDHTPTGAAPSSNSNRQPATSTSGNVNLLPKKAMAPSQQLIDISNSLQTTQQRVLQIQQSQSIKK